MLSSAQLAAVQSGRYEKHLRFTFGLKTGQIKWTSQPYDDDGFSAQSFVVGLGEVVQATGLEANTAKIELAGALSVLAAFENCENAPVHIEMIIVKDGLKIDNWVTLYSGVIDRYNIKHGPTKNRLLLEMVDFVTAKSGTNTYQMTQNDQARRFNGDTCLQYMDESSQSLFWGAE